MNHKNIVIREDYEVNGEKRVRWNNIGVLFQSKEGKEYCKLHHIPGVLLYVFEQEDKPKGQGKTQDAQAQPASDPELQPDENLPF